MPSLLGVTDAQRRGAWGEQVIEIEVALAILNPELAAEKIVSLRALVVEMTEGLEDCADQFCSDDPTEANFRKCIEALIAKAKEEVK